MNDQFTQVLFLIDAAVLYAAMQPSRYLIRILISSQLDPVIGLLLEM